MPHLVLEHSANVAHLPDLAVLLRELHEALAATGAFELDNIKSRVVRHDAFRVAEGAGDRAFVHLTAAVLSGRSADVLEAAAQALLAVLHRAFFPARSRQRCDVTLELREMPRDRYYKL